MRRRSYAGVSRRPRDLSPSDGTAPAWASFPACPAPPDGVRAVPPHLWWSIAPATRSIAGASDATAVAPHSYAHLPSPTCRHRHVGDRSAPPDGPAPPKTHAAVTSIAPGRPSRAIHHTSVAGRPLHITQVQSPESSRPPSTAVAPASLAARTAARARLTASTTFARMAPNCTGEPSDTRGASPVSQHRSPAAGPHAPTSPRRPPALDRETVDCRSKTPHGDKNSQTFVC